jgi:FkbM family methyltransferase
MIDIKWIIKYRILKHPKPTEPKVTEIMLKIKGDLFIDIGSNTGWYGKTLRKNFREILTIDPNPKWKADLEIAIGKENRIIPFYTFENTGAADSLIDHVHILGKNYENRQTRLVNVRTFDSLGRDADLVKVDVEGAEFEVLAGMVKHRPKNLVVELHDERREDELIQTSLNMGYKGFQIDSNHWLFKR